VVGATLRPLAIATREPTDGTPPPTRRFTPMSGLAAAEVRPVDSQLLVASSASACAPLVLPRRDNAGADAFALAVALAIMGNDTPVGLDGSPHAEGLVKGGHALTALSYAQGANRRTWRVSLPMPEGPSV
jgi:hypothetical protein